MARLARILQGLALLGIIASLLATFVWIVATIAVRPLDGVEGDVLFEAQRMRQRFPLYVDPVVGAHEYGEPPARYLVLYPPLWSAFLAIVPVASAPLFGRVVATLAWLGVIAWIAWRAPSVRRRPVLVFAAFLAGTWVLSLFGAAARPDALAIAFLGIALERAVRLGRADAIAGALFALAAWTKPNVIGAAPGAVLACVIASPRRALPGIAGLLGTSAVIAGILSALTGRVWLQHFLASTAQPPSLALWQAQMIDRVPFFALPFGGLVVLGWRARADASVRIALYALASSIGWTLLSLAKIGSATNYLMEPSIAALVLSTRVDIPPFRVLASALAVAQLAWNGTANLKGAITGIPLARERAAAIAEARSTCGADHGIILADEPGLELALNGRIVATPFQTTHRARAGAFPNVVWLGDIVHPNVACFVAQDDLLERPADATVVEHDRFGPELRGVLRDRFELVLTRGGFRIYRLKR